jgi:uncharacterized protein (TIGR03792 family)
MSQLVSRLLAGLLLSLYLLAAPAALHAMVAASPERPAVVEYLRVRVPAASREAWLTAEQESWGPWLANQAGFLGRDLYWDPNREEGVLLIRWRTPDDWSRIPAEQLDAVQERFETVARRASGLSSGNPFPLVAEGRLLPEPTP